MKILLFLIILLLVSKNSYAQSTDLIINEIQIEPLQQVEILNTGNQDIDISMFYIDDDSGSTYFTIPQNSVIQSGKCLVFTGNFNFNKTSPDTVRLFSSSAPPTSQGAALIDSYSYLKSPSELLSFQKTTNEDSLWVTAKPTIGFFNTSDQLTSCLSVTPTPQPSATPILTMSPTPITSRPTSPTPQNTNTPTTDFSSFNKDFSKISLSEIMPNPTNNEREWVEIYNSSDLPTNLDLWFIDDKENFGSTPRQISGVVNPKDFLIIYIDPPMLNNTQDDVILIDNNLNKIDQISYLSTIKNFSYAKDKNNSNIWCFQTPTPNRNNNECIEDEPSLIDETATNIASIKQAESSEKTRSLSEIKNNQKLEKAVYFAQISNIPPNNISKQKKEYTFINNGYNLLLSGKNNLFYASLLSIITFAGIIAKMWNEIKKNSF